MGDAPASETGTAAVELAAVSKRFGDVAAVDGIDLEIGDGEFFALLGPSGCGKTTTLRLIAGLEVPTAGSLRIFGDELGTAPPDKRPVNTVFQHYALFPHLDVRANVGFGLKMRGIDRTTTRRRVAEALEMVHLEELGGRRPDQLSGGQQQRVALARALVNRPKVLLLDEPLGALDQRLRQAMQSELKSLQRDVGITFVLVTHDQEEALTMSDRIAVMHDGRLLQVGEPDTVYEHPSSHRVAEFIGRTNLFPATVADRSTVSLANGVRLHAPSALPAGTAVSVLLRPERATLIPPDTPAPSAATTIDGIVAGSTYVGSAIVYRVAVDWMHLEVRVVNEPTVVHYTPGSPVTVSLLPGALSLIQE